MVPNECGLDNILIMDIRVVPHLFRLLAFLKLLYIIHEKGKRELRSYLKVLILHLLVSQLSFLFEDLAVISTVVLCLKNVKALV